MNKGARNICPTLIHRLKQISELLYLKQKGSKSFLSRNAPITPNVISSRISEMSSYLALAF